MKPDKSSTRYLLLFCLAKAVISVLAPGSSVASAQTSPMELPAFTIPAVASIRGQQNSEWRSELVIYNRAERVAELKLVFRTSAPVGSERGTTIQVLPGVSTYSNVLVDLGFVSTSEFAGGIGSLLVYTNEPNIYVTSRTYNVTAGLSAAEEIPGYSPDQLIRAGEKAVVIAPSDPTTYRFNYGIAVSSLTRAAATIRRFSRSGVLVSQESFVLAPPPTEFLYGYNPIFHRQWALRDGTGSEIIEVVVTEGAIVLYGSAVSQTTGHPLYTPPIRVK
jgi:hypothetical protein